MSNKKTIKNEISNSTIGRDFIGNQENNFKIDASELFIIEAMEEFSLNASAYICEAAEKIKPSEVEDEDFGLLANKLREKFSNMKCSDSYIKEFKDRVVYFPSIDDIATSDSITGGTQTIRNILTYICKMYLQIIDNYKNGDEIHNVIFSKISCKLEKPEHKIAADIFICYVINQCGIFNEKK